MARQYKQLPSLEELRSRLRLTDEYPSGLEWAETTARHAEGQMAGYLEQLKRYYVVSLSGEKYHAHRIVYYMRTGNDPGNADVVRPGDVPRDQLPAEMLLEQRSTPKPRTRRNRRKSDWY
jgi:hypothetical protein